MRTWIITEDDVRAIMNNAFEVAKSGASNIMLKNDNRCLIRGRSLLNPLTQAIYFAVTHINNIDDARLFSLSFARTLKAILSKDTETSNILPHELEEIYSHAIEVETK